MSCDKCSHTFADHACVLRCLKCDEANEEQLRLADHSLKLADELAKVSLEAKWFFVYRDEMNSYVHLSPVRLSPLTEKLRDALNAYEQSRKQCGERGGV